MTTSKNIKLSNETIKELLDENGYVVIPNVLSKKNIERATKMVLDWESKIPDLMKSHKVIDFNGIYKFHEVGHQEHAWLLRTRPEIQDIFKYLWDTKELTVSYDGLCHIPKDYKKKDSCWTHTDQAPCKEGLKCYQGFVSLTNNEERTFVVYKGSHRLHRNYCVERNLTKNTKNWLKIEPKYLETIAEKKKVVKVKAGSLVLWDSRTFHQNQYGKPNSEERIVQYVCYLPKNNPLNTKTMREKHKKYFQERRTTSHWPYPIIVNSKQPQTYGDNSKLINYDSLPNPNLDYLMDEINKII